MAGGTSHKVLRKIATATKRDQDAYALGVFFASSTSRTIEDLRQQAVADRISLAREILATAEKLYSARPRQNRSAVSRYYYSMYHALRAVTFFSFGGDDHEAHRILPGKLPTDFPAAAYWANSLKSARENRNSADYDPYPVDGLSWRAMATNLRNEAPRLLAATEQYLRTMGCGHL